MPQVSMSESIEQMENAGLLKRYSEKKRVDELPRIMEDNPSQAVLVSDTNFVYSQANPNIKGS